MGRKSGRRSTILTKEGKEQEKETEQAKASCITNLLPPTDAGKGDEKKENRVAPAEVEVKEVEEVEGEVEVVRLSEEWIVPSKEAFVKGSELQHVLCPLCLSCDVSQPVLIHEANPKTGLSCVACRDCVRRWLPVVECEVHTSAGVHCPLCDMALTSKDVGFQKELHSVGGPTETALLPLANQRLSSAGGAAPVGPTTCGVCEEKKSPLLMCLQCNFALCEECRASTHSKGMFKTHEVVRLDQVRKADHAKRCCPTHGGQNLELYCQTCAESVCVTCCFGGIHKGHDVVPLADIAGDTKNQMHSIATELNVKSEASMSVHNSLAALLPLHKTCVSRVEKEIQDNFAALHDLLKAREQSLLDRLLVHSKDMQQEMQQLVQVGASLSDSLRCSFTSLDGLIAELHPVTLMEVVDAVQRTCASMTDLTESTLDKLTAAQQVLKHKLSSAPERMAHFRLLPGQMGNEAALKEYQKIFSSLGSLTAASRVRDLIEADGGAEEEEEEKRSLAPTAPVGTEVARATQDEEEEAEKPQPHVPLRVEEKQALVPTARALRLETSSSVVDSSSLPSSSPTFNLSLQPLDLSDDRKAPLTQVNPNALPRGETGKLSLQEFQFGSTTRRTEAHNVLSAHLLQPLDTGVTQAPVVDRKRPWSDGPQQQQQQQQNVGGSLQLTWSPPTKVSRTTPMFEGVWNGRRADEEKRDAPVEKSSTYLQLHL